MNVSGAIVNIVLLFVVGTLKGGGGGEERLNLIINIAYMTRAKFPD